MQTGKSDAIIVNCFSRPSKLESISVNDVALPYCLDMEFIKTLSDRQIGGADGDDGRVPREHCPIGHERAQTEPEHEHHPEHLCHVPDG